MVLIMLCIHEKHMVPKHCLSKVIFEKCARVNLASNDYEDDKNPKPSDTSDKPYERASKHKVNNALTLGVRKAVSPGPS